MGQTENASTHDRDVSPLWHLLSQASGISCVQGIELPPSQFRALERKVHHDLVSAEHLGNPFQIICMLRGA